MKKTKWYSKYLKQKSGILFIKNMNKKKEKKILTMNCN